MERIEKVLEEAGVKYDIKDDYALVEFWTDTAGQDIPVELYFDEKPTPENFVKKFSEYAENYDVDDEVELFVNMRGKRDVPESIRELLDDCQEAKDTLIELASKMKAAISTEEQSE